MQIDSHPTTPFGRRPATLGQIAAQMKARRAIEDAALPGSNAPAAINKWHLFRTLTEVRERLGVSDRALSVLNALLSFHQETALTLPKPRRAASGAADAGDDVGASCDLVVFPSNKAPPQRAHGMAGSTLWRHLTALVDAGLIIRRDSPNGKRYARRDAAGRGVSDAFGFDLTPLVTRAGEFEALAEELRALLKQRYLARERVSLLRRDVGKMIALGLDEGMPGDWEAFRQRCMELMTPLRRVRNDRDMADLEARLAQLRLEASMALESHIDSHNLASNDSHFHAHQSNTKPQSHTVLEPASEKEGGCVGSCEQPDGVASSEAVETRAYPLGMVMEACPDIRDYAPAGDVRTWSEFLAAAGAVRPMIGISPDAWAQAREVLGDTPAHVVVATILQRSVYSSEAETGHGPGAGPSVVTVNGSPAIQSAGGYLRALTEKATAGEFALGPVLMALIGQRLKAKRRGGGRS
jgi:replication initiation protein RepC